MPTSFWTLNEKQYFEAPGLVATVFHDFYPEGKQGGLTLIQHGERVATCGDVRLEPTPGQWHPRPKIGERQVDDDTVTIPAHFEDANVAYTVRVCPEGKSLHVSVDLAEPLPAEWEGKVAFILNYRLAGETVAKHIERHYIDSFGSLSERLSYAKSTKNTPYPAGFGTLNGVTWLGQIHCGL